MGCESKLHAPRILNITPHCHYCHHRILNVDQRDLGLLQCRGRSKEMVNISMQDNWVIDIIELVGLEGLFRTPSREINHSLISALVERWRPETHTFHLLHGEMSITLQDMEVILGLPIDSEVLVGPIGGEGGLEHSMRGLAWFSSFGE
ncbi:hypothetical protein SO802_027104 [Lithocarpus litseifolius]|uniref:Aminotransferase-like plant mobile domain-containing protein n=1 Tax=Lithocarpus litseifolius TaxID=425828 RepID=A0AAW2C594_9ROSI